MFASLMYDALAGVGCVTVAFGGLALTLFALGIWLGLLPGVKEKLKKLGKDGTDEPA